MRNIIASSLIALLLTNQLWADSLFGTNVDTENVVSWDIVGDNNTYGLVVGGGQNVSVGGVNLSVDSDNLKVVDVFIGGIYNGGDGKNVNGNINIEFYSGSVNTFFVGGNYQSVGTVNGDIGIKTYGGNFYYGIRAGSMSPILSGQNFQTTDSNTNVYIGGNTVIDTSGNGNEAYSVAGSYVSVNGATLTIAENASIKGDIYGGGGRTLNDISYMNKNDLPDSVVANSANKVTMNIEGGNIEGNVYGGALKYSAVGSAEINVSGGKINGNVYLGGGEGGSGKYALTKGDSSLNISGGEITGNVYASGSNQTSKMLGNVVVNLSSDAKIGGTIYGNAENAIVEGTKTLNIGTSSEAYSNSVVLNVADFDKINVQGNSDAKIESIVQNLSGEVQGSRTVVADGSKLTVLGNIENTLTNATNSGSFVAGITGGDAIVNGTVKTVIDGENTSLHYVYGGNGGNQKKNEDGKLAPKGTSTVGAVDLTVNNGSVDMIVGSGAMFSNVEGNVDVKVNGGNVGSIFGVGSTTSIGGDVNIAVKNATVEHITAAGSGINETTASVVNGSTSITLGENAVITEDIYAGGWGDGKRWPTVVKGNSTVTLTSNATVQGTIHGGGWNSQYDVVEGTKTLNIGTSSEAYSGSTALKVADFDKINVESNSNVKFTGIAADNSAKMIMDAKGNATVSDATYSNITNRSAWNNGENYSTTPLLSVQSGGSLSVESSSFENNSLIFENSPASGVGAQGLIKVSGGSLSVKNSSFEGNLSNTTPADGAAYPNTQGSAIYASSALNVEVSGTKFAGNKSSAKSVQGGALALFGGSYTLSNNVFDGNKSDASMYQGDGWAYGAAGYISDSWQDSPINLTINSNEFNNNLTEGTGAYGGALYIYQGKSGSGILIENSSFANNKAVGEEEALGGALYLNGGSSTIKNTVFSSNGASVGNYDFSYNGGGAIIVRNANVTISADKNIKNSGNYFSQNGTLSDERGGFLFMRGTSSVNFDISENATYEIGDGRSGYDSISSEVNAGSNHTINKIGLGTLTVNSSMEHYTGALNVNGGVMNVNNKLGASSVNIASGAVLSLTINGSNTLSNSNLTFSNAGTLSLVAGGSLEEGSYALSANSSIADFGSVKAYGGIFAENIFTVGSAEKMDLDKAGEALTVENNGRVSLTESGSESTVISMAFNSDYASVNKVNTTTQNLLSQIGSDFAAAASYSFDVIMDGGDTVVLSFLVDNPFLNLSDFSIYHKADGEDVWAVADDVSNVSYDGKYLSFIVSHFSEYGYAAIPEPSTYAAILGAIALAFAAYRRRK